MWEVIDSTAELPRAQAISVVVVVVVVKAVRRLEMAGTV